MSALQSIAAEPAPPGVSSSASSVPTEDTPGPRIRFDQTTYDFGKVESGQLIKHTFFFTNTGNQLLEVREVRPSCGCTTTGAWDKQVEAGKFGVIPIQFNSAGYGGPVHKSITVVCNDPGNSNLFLQITGTAWKPIDISPSFASFSFGPDFQTNETRVLRIVNNLDEPVVISAPTCTNPAFQPELTTVKEGKEYELRVTVLPPLTTPSVSASVILKTSYAKTPLLNVTAFASVQPAISVLPPQLMLPPGPLTNSVPLVVTLQNNSTNPVALSEPKLNVEGAETTLKEVQPGKRFELTAVFPAAFRIQNSPTVELTVKSSFPQLPVIKIPVFQSASPPNATAPPASQKASAGPVPPHPNTESAETSTVSPATNGHGTVHGPKIEFATTAFDFGRVESGKVVTHTFPFTNGGDQPLEIQDVYSSCGCTAAANYSRHVEPGQPGDLPVLFNTSGMSGMVMKMLRVHNNDLQNSNVIIQIVAEVFKPIDALPSVAAFSFGPDFQTNESQIIRLVSNLDEPVTISSPVCTNKAFQVSLSKVKEGKEFELRVTVVPPLPPGSIVAPITLNTSSAKMPVVTATAYAMVQPALTIMPPRLRLPEALLANPAQFTVRIQNQSTNSLQLSQPEVNADGARVAIHEVQPGRLFELTIGFPAGFRAAPGDEIEARAKSSLPQMPYVKVPVLPPLAEGTGPKAEVGLLR